MDRIVTSWNLSQEMDSFARQQVSAWTVRQRLQQHGLLARRSWHLLFLTLHHRQERFQWFFNNKPGLRNGVVSSTNLDSIYNIIMIASSFGCIVEYALCQRTFDIIIVGHYLEWWYGMPLNTRLGHIDGTLKNGHYISVLLRPVALTFIRAMRNAKFQQDNTRLHVDGIVRTFLDTQIIRLLPWPGHSPKLSPIENAWSMVAKKLARHHKSLTIVDEMWNLDEAV